MEHDFNRNVGRRLYEARKAKGYSRAKVGEMVGLHESTVKRYEDGDIKGPFALGVAAEKTIDDETTSRMIVLGSAWILTDDTNSMVSGNHARMFTDMMSQITSQKELASSVIPVKDMTLSTLTIDTATALTWALIIVIIVPLVMLGVGIVIWYLRRKK